MNVLDNPSRLKAAFLRSTMLLGVVLIAGCSASNSPTLVTLRALLPGGGPDAGAEAKKISYASLELHVARRGGLLVLAEQGGHVTFWQTSRRESIELRDGYLASTNGFAPELTMTQINAPAGNAPWMTADPPAYTLVRSWISTDGSRHTEQARAALTCANGVEPVKLPLATLELQKCRETLDWAQGATTASVYWRHPGDHHIWAAQVVPWPGAPEYDWKVARPWW